MTIDSPRPDQTPALRQLWQQAFGDTDEFLDGFFSVGFAPERCRIVLMDNQVVAALYWFDCEWASEKVAYLYAVATAPTQQGKGHCRHLMEDTHIHLKQLGYRGAILVPGDASLFALYKKFGYVPCCKVRQETVFARAEGVPLKPISAVAYGSVQAKYLPGDCVFHKQSTLAFVSTFNRFYEGNGFVFCGAMDNDTFFFQAFLGKPEALPGILAALGAKKGVLRLPGSTPYAMFRNFGTNKGCPEVFEIPLN